MMWEGKLKKRGGLQAYFFTMFATQVLLQRASQLFKSLFALLAPLGLTDGLTVLPTFEVSCR